MKNLFSFATKELSQDAFLRWLLENATCEDEQVRSAAQMLLRSFLDFPEARIKSVVTYAQIAHTDICAEVETTDGRKWVVVIEDKADSLLHNDLDEYEKQIKNRFDTCYNYKFVFYKTGHIFRNEKQILAQKHQPWKQYGLREIVQVFATPLSNLPQIRNNILHDYLEYIRFLQGLREMPVRNWTRATYCDVLEKNLIKFQDQYAQIDTVNSFAGVWPQGAYPLIWIELSTDKFEQINKWFGECNFESKYKLTVALEFQFRKKEEDVCLKTTIKLFGRYKADDHKWHRVCIQSSSQFAKELRNIRTQNFVWSKNQSSFWSCEENVGDLDGNRLEETLSSLLSEALFLLDSIK